MDDRLTGRSARAVSVVANSSLGQAALPRSASNATTGLAAKYADIALDNPLAFLRRRRGCASFAKSKETFGGRAMLQ